MPEGLKCQKHEEINSVFDFGKKKVSLFVECKIILLILINET